MVFRHPEALVAHGLGGYRQGDGLLQRVGGGATFTHGRLIEYAELQWGLHAAFSS
jgi:hypothetical protein